MADLIAVNDVLTHEQLDDYLGGKLTAQVHIAPKNDIDTVKTRTQALDEVLEALAARTPPIYERDITRPSELRSAVKHGAAKNLYRNAMTSGADAELFHALMKAEAVDYAAAVNALRPTVGDGSKATAWSIGISRR